MSEDKIERVSGLTRTDFETNFVIPGRPVIILDAMARWPAVERWSAEYFIERFGDRELPVRMHSRAEWHADHDQFSSKSVREVLPELMGATAENPPRFFVAQVPVLGHAPWLMPDIDVPDIFELDALSDINFWLQGESTKTMLHWDSGDGLLALVRGEKRARLFSPTQHRYLYPAERNSFSYNWSRVNVLEPDLVRYPEFRNATWLECTLYAGETLFIPRYWWHWVSTTMLGFGVNFWWDRPLDLSPEHDASEQFYRDRQAPPSPPS